jgi:hypothetical protein
VSATLNEQVTMGSVFEASFHCAQNQLVGFCDSDHTPDIDTRNPKVAILFLLNGHAVA